VSLTDWPDHPELKKLQQEFLSGVIPKQCQPCVNQERTQGRSLRTDSNKDYNNEFITETCIDFIDYRSSNICNFKCRSCDPWFSHGIAQEARNNPELIQIYGAISQPDTKTVSVTSENSKWIVDNLSQIKRLMFTGGEPTVIPEIKLILQEIAKNHNTIQVMLTSNASFTDSFWYDITDKIDNLHWTLSLDAVGSAAEIVRHGTDWNIVSRNAEWLAKHANSLDINTVVSNLNLLQLGPLLKFVRQLQQISILSSGDPNNLGCRHQFYVCQRPYYLSADNWPDKKRDFVLSYLNQCLNQNLDAEQTNMLQGLINQIKSSDFDLELWNKNLQFNGTLDQIRNQDHTKLFKFEMI
jgi:sulfatase maturation enzyme AslB (radical SAM superfamily)